MKLVIELLLLIKQKHIANIWYCNKSLIDLYWISPFYKWKHSKLFIRCLNWNIYTKFDFLDAIKLRRYRHYRTLSRNIGNWISSSFFTFIRKLIHFEVRKIKISILLCISFDWRGLNNTLKRNLSTNSSRLNYFFVEKINNKYVKALIKYCVHFVQNHR